MEADFLASGQGVIAKIKPLSYVYFNVKYLYLRSNEGSNLSDHSQEYSIWKMSKTRMMTRTGRVRVKLRKAKIRMKARMTKTGV